MQQYKIEQQSDAYLTIKSYSNPKTTTSVLSKIMADAKVRYPSDYEMQVNRITQQAEAYLRLESVATPVEASLKRGHSRRGLSAGIHATVDALGNPTGFFLTGGEAHDLVGADHLLPQMQAETLIADKAFDGLTLKNA